MEKKKFKNYLFYPGQSVTDRFGHYIGKIHTVPVRDCDIPVSVLIPSVRGSAAKDDKIIHIPAEELFIEEPLLDRCIIRDEIQRRNLYAAFCRNRIWDILNGLPEDSRRIEIDPDDAFEVLLHLPDVTHIVAPKAISLDKDGRMMLEVVDDKERSYVLPLDSFNLPDGETGFLYVLDWFDALDTVMTLVEK